MLYIYIVTSQCISSFMTWEYLTTPTISSYIGHGISWSQQVCVCHVNVCRVIPFILASRWTSCFVQMVGLNQTTPFSREQIGLGANNCRVMLYIVIIPRILLWELSIKQTLYIRFFRDGMCQNGTLRNFVKMGLGLSYECNNANSLVAMKQDGMLWDV